jgi:hypothetical protein
MKLEDFHLGGGGGDGGGDLSSPENLINGFEVKPTVELLWCCPVRCCQPDECKRGPTNMRTRLIYTGRFYLLFVIFKIYNLHILLFCSVIEKKIFPDAAEFVAGSGRKAQKKT